MQWFYNISIWASRHTLRIRTLLIQHIFKYLTKSLVTYVVHKVIVGLLLYVLPMSCKRRCFEAGKGFKLLSSLSPTVS